MKSFYEIAEAYDALASELLAFIAAHVPADGAMLAFHVDHLSLRQPGDDRIVFLHALRSIGDGIWALGYAADDDQIGDFIEPIPVTDFLLDELYSIAGQLAD